MMKRVIAVTCALFITVSLWALEPDDKAIVGVWLLDGDYKDLSGNDNKGKETGDFKFGNGKFGDAVFAKGGGATDVKDSPSLLCVEKELTIAAWFRVDADSDTGPRKNGAYLLEDQSNGEPVKHGFSFRIWTSDGITPGFYGKTELEQKKWYHVAGTYDGKNVEMYVDGKPESKKGALDAGGADWKPEWGGAIQPGSTLQLKFGSESFTGGIDEIVICNRALDADEIGQLLNGWADAFAVAPQSKLATTWSRIKSRE